MPKHSSSAPKKRSQPKASAGKRTIRLHASFSPPDASKLSSFDDSLEFSHLFCDAQEIRRRKTSRELRARERELRARERDLEARTALIPKVGGIFQDYLDGEIDGATAAERFKTICPDERLQHELFDLFTIPSAQLTIPSSQPGMTEEELEKEEQTLVRADRVLKAWDQSAKSLEKLAEHARAGEEDAIKNLAAIAEHAIQHLMIAEKMHPEKARKIAGSRSHWPLLASREPGWERRAVERMQDLELGKHLEVFRSPFRTARGADDNYPARKWAKAAVRTLEETRWRYLVFRHYREELRELIFEQGVDLCHAPDWPKSACRLPLFSVDTSREWGVVIREMIREQTPDFHTAPEWQSQRNTAFHNARDTRGEIQNAILDDIVSALRSIAPQAEVPKSDS